ncbi:hypothetical protein [Aquimarina sp. 2304DJ70-9]|uniref:hypothetical protein n=1 Tax=Aquimarina penaris TaxID=3231044 RepID=UPI0034626CF3
MKKNILFYLFIILSINTFGQSLTKLGFDKIHNEIRNITSSINSEKDFDILVKRFNLTEEQSELIEKLKKSEVLKFNEGRDLTKNFILPFYVKSEHDDRLFLTLFAITNVGRKPGEKFSRGRYYFVLQCLVGLDKTYNVVFENPNLITDKQKIQKWFLDGHKDYVKNTKPIHTKYDFIPPPPPLPPNTLK